MKSGLAQEAPGPPQAFTQYLHSITFADALESKHYQEAFEYLTVHQGKYNNAPCSSTPDANVVRSREAPDFQSRYRTPAGND